MKKQLLCVLLALCVVATAFSLAGCGSKTADVYFLNFKPESAAIYEEIAKKYEEETGKKLKVVTAAANTYEQTLKSEIAKKNAPTIFQINGPIGYNEWKDYCLDLKNTKFYSYLTDKSLAITENGGVYGIPYAIEGYGIIYNKAITDKYFTLSKRQKTVNSMDEINSYAKLKTVVEDMTKHKSELGIDGVFAATSLSSGEDWRWQTHLMNVPLYYEFMENEQYDDPTVAGLNTTDITFKYGENFKNIFDLYTDNSTTGKNLLGAKSVADSMAEFALGKAAMVQNGNWAWSQIAEVNGNTVKAENIKFLPIYTGFESEENQGICVGTENYLAINAKSSKEQQQASLEFLEWLFSSQTGKYYVTKELGFITPFNTFEADEQPSDPLAAEVTRWIARENTTTVPWIFTSFPSENFKTKYGNSLLEYVQGSRVWEDVKRDVVDFWKSER